MLSTIHRRHILSLFEKEQSISFSRLKEIFLEKKEMNPTTLYRILDAFVREHVIHEIRLDGDRIFTRCHGKKDEGIKLTYCLSCKKLDETHFPLDPKALKSETVEYLRYCHHCS